MSRFHRENPDQPIVHDAFEGAQHPKTTDPPFGIPFWIVPATPIPAEQPLTIEVQIPLIGPNFKPRTGTVLKTDERKGSTDADVIASLLAIAFLLIPLLYALWLGFLWCCGVDIDAYTQIN